MNPIWNYHEDEDGSEGGYREARANICGLPVMVGLELATGKYGYGIGYIYSPTRFDEMKEAQLALCDAVRSVCGLIGSDDTEAIDWAEDEVRTGKVRTVEIPF